MRKLQKRECAAPNETERIECNECSECNECRERSRASEWTPAATQQRAHNARVRRIAARGFRNEAVGAAAGGRIVETKVDGKWR